MASKERQPAGTPPVIFDVLQREYSFGVDIAASSFNAKLPVYVTEEQDAFSFSWEKLRIWCNPPYNDIERWLDRSAEPHMIAYLLPARTDRFWWMKYKPLAEVHYFVGEKPHKRVQFVPPPGVRYSTNPGSNILMLFGDGTVPGLEAWRSGRTGERL